jgi:tetratricopeptide (TPR) repeat protein
MARDDAELAINLVPLSEENRLVLGQCYMRLQKLTEAADCIKTVIKLNPDNELALYQEAFCHRLDGRYREAIENLTKIISGRERVFNSTRSNNSTSHQAGEEVDTVNFSSFLELPNEDFSIPLNEIFEMRGILLHEGKAFKYGNPNLT